MGIDSANSCGDNTGGPGCLMMNPFKIFGTRSGQSDNYFYNDPFSYNLFTLVNQEIHDYHESSKPFSLAVLLYRLKDVILSQESIPFDRPSLINTICIEKWSEYLEQALNLLKNVEYFNIKNVDVDQIGKAMTSLFENSKDSIASSRYMQVS